MKRLAGVVLVLAVLAFLAHCVLVTGDTSGYALDAGGGSCSRSADCDDARCCLTLSVTASGISTVAACQSGAQCRPLLPVPGVQVIQLCEGGAECPDDAACLPQQCLPGDAGGAAIRACGHVFGCTLL